MKKGQIWISAVLYIALGVVSITIILSAGVPVINKIKDKNTITQTKEIFFTLDNIIREVRDEGPGSRRVISPFIVKGGNMFIKENENKITWEMKTSSVYVEPCGRTKLECEHPDPQNPDDTLIIKEGPVNMYELKTIVEDEYVMNLELDYDKVAFLTLKGDLGRNSPLIGTYSLKIENTGINPQRQSAHLPDIEIQLT